MLRDRKVRLALVVAFAAVVLFVAWRTHKPKEVPCETGRQEERDASGKVTRITRTECREEG